jgi:hypothetical protein
MMPGTRKAYQPDFTVRHRFARPFRRRHDAAAFPEVEAVHHDVGDEDRDEDQQPGDDAARNRVETAIPRTRPMMI